MACCRRNHLLGNRLGRSASSGGVARRSRTRLRVRHAPRALRASQLGPARPRGILIGALSPAYMISRVIGRSISLGSRLAACLLVGMDDGLDKLMADHILPAKRSEFDPWDIGEQRLHLNKP